MRRSILQTTVVSGVSLFALVGVVAAATTHDVTRILGGKTGDYFDVNGTILADSLRIGAQGVGGVTYFNGTIINNTTNSDNTGNPVTIGDKLRVDDALWRGATEGPGDNLPLKLNDDVNIYGNLTMSSGKTLNVTGVTFTGLNIGPNEIVDYTKRVLLPTTSFLSDADGTPTQLSAVTVPKLQYTANQGLFLQYAKDDTTDIGTQFVVPDDYVSGGVFKMVVDTSGSIVTNWDVGFKTAIGQVSGTSNAWATSMASETAVDVSDTPGKPRVLTFTPTNQADISAGDTVFVDFFPANNTGAGEPNLEIYNTSFEYTANQ